MPINDDLNDVPRRSTDGLPPSRNPFAVTALADQWWKQYTNANAEHAIPAAGPYRMSFASKRCDRQLYYAMAGAPETDPPTVADVWRMALGELVHEALQDARTAAFPTSANEVVVDLNAIGIPGSGRIDIVDGDLLVELKTINGFSFKMIATSFKGGAQGPRYGAVVQAALAAAAMTAGGMVVLDEFGVRHPPVVHEIKRIVVGYLSLELVGPGMIDVTITDDNDLAREIARFTAEWHFTADELAPIAAYEVSRVQRIQRMIDAGTLPARELHDPEYPDGAVVTAPKVKSTPWQLADGNIVVDSGTTWFCGYCSQRQRCVDDGVGGDDGVEVSI